MKKEMISGIILTNHLFIVSEKIHPAVNCCRMIAVLIHAAL